MKQSSLIQILFDFFFANYLSNELCILPSSKLTQYKNNNRGRRKHSASRIIPSMVIAIEEKKALFVASGEGRSLVGDQRKKQNQELES